MRRFLFTQRTTEQDMLTFHKGGLVLEQEAELSPLDPSL